MTQLERLEALAEKATKGPRYYEAVAVPVQELADLIRVARAAWHIGWNDDDGKCWCLEATVVTGLPHSRECSALRSAMAPLFAEVES